MTLRDFGGRGGDGPWNGSWRSGSILFLDLGAGYIGVFTLWKCIEMYLMLCIQLCGLRRYVKKKKYSQNTVWLPKREIQSRTEITKEGYL